MAVPLVVCGWLILPYKKHFFIVSQMGMTCSIFKQIDKKKIRIHREFLICWREGMRDDTKKLFGRKNIKIVNAVLSCQVCQNFRTMNTKEKKSQKNRKSKIENREASRFLCYFVRIFQIQSAIWCVLILLWRNITKKF